MVNRMRDLASVLAQLLIRLHQRTRRDFRLEPLRERRRRSDLARDLEPVDQSLRVVVLCIRLKVWVGEVGE